MTTDEQSIIDLTRENGRLKQEVEKLELEQSSARMAMRKVGVPSYFEDGNDGDDLSMGEQVDLLCGMYEREKSVKDNALKALEIHTGKKAPVQGYAPGIPWDMHMEAYAAYCKKYGKQDALIEGWCRGGFGTGELDMFIPGWRDELKRRHDVSRQTAQ